MASAQREYNHIKALIVGDSGVGKSSLQNREVNDTYSDTPIITTIGIDFKIKPYDLTVHGQLKRTNGQIWDTFKTKGGSGITTSEARGADVIFVVYDVTNEQSFQNARDWISTSKPYANENANFVLIGNKCDNTAERQVEKQRGESLAAEYRIPFFETSAKYGTNVNKAFAHGLTMAAERLMPTQSPAQSTAPPKSQGFAWWQWLLWGLAIVTVVPIIFYGIYKFGEWIYDTWRARSAAPNVNAIAPAPAAQPPAVQSGSGAGQFAQLHNPRGEPMTEQQAEASREEKRRAEAAEQKAASAQQEAAAARQREAAERRRADELAKEKQEREAQNSPEAQAAARLKYAKEELPKEEKAHAEELAKIKEKIGDTEVPGEHLCQISLEIMTNPVTWGEHTYDRISVLQLIVQTGGAPTHPSTRYPMTGSDLSAIQRNLAVKDNIGKWVDETKRAKTTASSPPVEPPAAH